MDRVNVYISLKTLECGGEVHNLRSGKERNEDAAQSAIHSPFPLPSPACSFSDRVEGGRSSQQLTITDN